MRVRRAERGARANLLRRRSSVRRRRLLSLSELEHGLLRGNIAAWLFRRSRVRPAGSVRDGSNSGDGIRFVFERRRLGRASLTRGSAALNCGARCVRRFVYTAGGARRGAGGGGGGVRRGFDFRRRARTDGDDVRDISVVRSRLWANRRGGSGTDTRLDAGGAREVGVGGNAGGRAGRRAPGVRVVRLDDERERLDERLRRDRDAFGVQRLLAG